VVERRQAVLRAVEIRPPVQTRELEAIPLKPPVNQEEIEAIELFLRRSPELNAAREQELAELVAPVFARRMQIGYRDPARLLALLYRRARGTPS
jgi:hypothetical protein